MANAFDELTKDSNENTLFVIHAGTNNIKNTRSEALLDKYRKMIKKYKTKSSNIIISGILPRINGANSFYDRAFSINSRLGNLCKEEGVEFLNLWNHFYDQKILFWKDGLHLNSVGSARLGRLFNDAVNAYQTKNMSRAEVSAMT